MDIAQTLQTILIYALPVLFSITIHEAAHGYAARHFGDHTASMLGRITLNPLKHIDPVGTFLLPALLHFPSRWASLSGSAQPVPVNFNNLRNPKRDMIWVALAGPASNLVQALLWLALFIVLIGVGVEERFFLQMAKGGVLVNLVMWAFNLFPLPPLDGGRILVGLLPYRSAATLSRVEPYGFFIVLALVLSGIVGTYWLRPLMDASNQVLVWLLQPLILFFS